MTVSTSSSRLSGASVIWSSSAENTAGTALMVVPDQLPRSASSSTSRTTSTLAPVVSAVKISNTETSKFTEVAASIRETAPTCTVRRRSCTPLTTLPWVMATPLGVPVDPDVNIT